MSEEYSMEFTKEDKLLDRIAELEEQLRCARGLLFRWLHCYNTNTVKGVIKDTNDFLKEE